MQHCIHSTTSIQLFSLLQDTKCKPSMLAHVQVLCCVERKVVNLSRVLCTAMPYLCLALHSLMLAHSRCMIVFQIPTHFDASNSPSVVNVSADMDESKDL